MLRRAVRLGELWRARGFICLHWVQGEYQGYRNGIRAPDKEPIFISTMSISSPNPMFDHSLESSHRDDSNKWSNIGFGEEMDIIEIKIRSLSGTLNPLR